MIHGSVCRLKDPLPYMAKYPEADILTSSDHLVSSCTFPVPQYSQLPEAGEPSAMCSCGWQLPVS